MRKISTSNYDEDDREFLPDFLQILRNMKKDCDNETLNKQLPVPDVLTKDITLSNIEMNILYNVVPVTLLLVL